MERPHRKIRFRFGRLLAAGLIAAAGLAGESYKIQPAAGSNFTLKVYKTGLLSGKAHIFVFERYGGEWEYAEGKPEDWSVRFTVETDSIVLTDDWLSETEFPKVMKEAREKMLAVEDHPTMTFASNSVLTRGAGRYEVQGDLTIRGRPQPAAVQLAVRRDSAEGFVLEGSSVIKLRDYGLKPPAAFWGAVGTKSEMDVTFKLQASK